MDLAEAALRSPGPMADDGAAQANRSPPPETTSRSTAPWPAKHKIAKGSERVIRYMARPPISLEYVSLRIRMRVMAWWSTSSSTPSPMGLPTGCDCGHPALRPSGQPAAVQNRSRRFCRAPGKAIKDEMFRQCEAVPLRTGAADLLACAFQRGLSPCSAKRRSSRRSDGSKLVRPCTRQRFSQMIKSLGRHRCW